MKPKGKPFLKGHQGYWKGKKRPSFSAGTRLKMGLVQRGRKQSKEHINNRVLSIKKNPRLRLTALSKRIRNSLEYRLWRQAVFQRDNYTCVFCGKHGGDLNADHIKPFALFPELRFAIDNGRTLCVPCHKLTDTFGKHICNAA